MLYVGSFVKVIDNSGARWVKCLKILGKSYKSRAKIGDLLVVTIKKTMPNKKAKKGEVYKAVVVRLKFRMFRYGGVFLSFDSSGVILLNSRELVLGSRILGPVCRELRQKNYTKILAMSPVVI